MVGMKAFVSLAIIALAASSQISMGEVKKVEPVEELGLNLCPTCVSLLSQTINQLLNIILNSTVIGGCSDLCGQLSNQLEQAACTLVCADVGIKGFIWAVDKADLDPVYMCELVSICPHSDTPGVANIAKIATSPPSGPQGTTFEIAVGFHVANQTNTGEIFVGIDCPAGMPIQSSQVNTGYAPGDYSLGFKLDTTQANQDDPFMPGTYNVTIALCEGSCGSDHEWAHMLDQQHSSFMIE